jgi:anti-anti-sigma factor
MKTSLQQWQGWDILSIEGIFVLRELHLARHAFEYFEERSGAKVALNLSKTKLLDSSAITLLMNLQKRLKDESGMLVILEPCDEIKSIFSVLEIENSIPVFYTRAEFESAVLEGAL